METVTPTKNETYTTTEIVYEVTLDNTLHDIVNSEGVSHEKETTQKGENVLPEPDE